MDSSSGGSLDNTTAPHIVQRIIQYGIEARASDVHCEPTPGGLQIRYRIDGLLVEGMCIFADYALRVITHLKVLACLDIGERRRPQDGRCSYALMHTTYDLRVATFPTLHGESIVLRILDAHNLPTSLADLGMPDALLMRLKAEMKRPHGLYLVTGPTGAGKSTTLYAIMRELIAPERLVITLEDPIEYIIPGAVQSQVRPDIEFTFAEGIKAIVRQDPDVIVIGEIRDRATADAAVRAALTGHMVLSTVHTIDAVGALTRLIEMGVSPYLLAAVIHGVIAQRLVRVTCHCNTSRTASALGCDSCLYRGYRGRVGIFESVYMTPQLRALIVENAPHDRLLSQALADGMIPLADEGRRLVAEGITSHEEVMRVLE